MDETSFLGALSAVIGFAFIWYVASIITADEKKVEGMIPMPGTRTQQEEYGDRFLRRYCPLCGTWTVTMRLRCDVDGCHYTATQEDTAAIETAVYERLFVHEWHSLENELRTFLTHEEVAAMIEMREDIDSPTSPHDLVRWLALRRKYDEYHAADMPDSEQRRLEFARWLYAHGRIHK